MKVLMGSLSALSVLLAFAIPFLPFGSAAQNEAVVVLVAVIFLVSICIGTWWFVRIQKTHINSSSSYKISADIDRVLNNSLLWLQGVRPAMSLGQGLSDASKVFDVSTVIFARFFSMFLVAISAMALSMIFLILSKDSEGQTGIFGLLLRSSSGKGLALAFCLYLGISSVSFLFLGLLSFFQGKLKK